MDSSQEQQRKKAMLSAFKQSLAGQIEKKTPKKPIERPLFPKKEEERYEKLEPIPRGS